jgi:hypothetical protein
MDRFRRASRDTFNNFFCAPEDDERTMEAFYIVEKAMFQVMVLDFLDVTGKSYHDVIDRIVVRPKFPNTLGFIQSSEAREIRLSQEDTIRFSQMYDTNFYAPRDGEFILGKILSCKDQSVVGLKVIVRYSEVEFIDM